VNGGSIGCLGSKKACEGKQYNESVHDGRNPG
jgi:hypothetical protein